MENLIFNKDLKRELNSKINSSMAIRVNAGACQLEFHKKDHLGQSIFNIPIFFHDYTDAKFTLDKESFFFYESIYSFSESTLSSILKLCKNGDELSFLLIRNCYSENHENNWIEGHLIINRGKNRFQLNIGIRPN